MIILIWCFWYGKQYVSTSPKSGLVNLKKSPMIMKKDELLT